MRGNNSIRVSKKIDNTDEGKQQLEVFRAFVEAGLEHFKGIPFEATFEIKEMDPSKKP